MLYEGLDIHQVVFQVVVLDPETGELRESRFEPSRERLNDWAIEWRGKLAAVAIEATTGWRWSRVSCRRTGRASALRGRRRHEPPRVSRGPFWLISSFQSNGLFGTLPSGLEGRVLGGCYVAEGAVEAAGVVPGDVFDDRELELGACPPDPVADQLGLQGVDEALGEGVDAPIVK